MAGNSLTTVARFLAAAAICCAFVAGGRVAHAQPAAEQEGPRVYAGRVLSESYHIDKIYKSMMGPSSISGVRLLETPERELLWIVGYSATVVDAVTLEPVSQEFMCHANLDLEQGELGIVPPTEVSGRLFTLSQGQQEVRFPPNHGIPVVSNQGLRLFTQVLNLNLPAADLNVKHSVEVTVMRDRDLVRPMTPLYQREIQAMKSLDEAGYYGMRPDEADPERHGQSCAMGEAASGSPIVTDEHGQEFIGHWVVNPGREVTRTNVTRWLNLNRDTTVHYVTVHLHPFAVSLALFDRTEKRTVYKARARNSKDKIGLEHVEIFSSDTGFPVYADHEYEMVSIYDNTSDEPVDAMAVMFLYMVDGGFEKPRF